MSIIAIEKIVHRKIPNQKMLDETLTAVLYRTNGVAVAKLGRGTSAWVAEHGEELSVEEAALYFPGSI